LKRLVELHDRRVEGEAGGDIAVQDLVAGGVVPLSQYLILCPGGDAVRRELLRTSLVEPSEG